jgi:MoaA/NifB/PqqE/SkfB family radical SAM enzyme
MPKELTIEITNVCPLHCKMCSSEAVAPFVDMATHLSLESIKSYVKKYADFEIIRLSGGETYKHPDFQRIVKAIKAENRQIVVLTSGNYDDHEPLPIEELQACRPHIDELVFSIHGNWDLHDCITTSTSNPNDVFDRQPIKNMLESVKRARTLQYNYSFHTCVLKENYNDLENIIKIVDEHCRADYQKTRLHFLKPVYQGRARDLEKLSKEDWDKIPEIAQSLGQKYNVEITYTGEHGCNCKEQKAAITWYGKEMDCSALKELYFGGKVPCTQPKQIRFGEGLRNC